MRVVCGSLPTALMVEHNRVPDRKVADLSEKIAALERQLDAQSNKEAALKMQVGGCNLAAAVVPASEPRFGVWALCRASVWSALDAQRWSFGCVVPPARMTWFPLQREDVQALLQKTHTELLSSQRATQVRSGSRRAQPRALYFHQRA